MIGEDLPARGLHLEHSVSSIRENMAQLATEQRHLVKTMERVDQRTERICKGIENMPSVRSLFKDPRMILLLIAICGGAVGVDTVAMSLIAPLSAQPAAIATP